VKILVLSIAILLGLSATAEATQRFRQRIVVRQPIVQRQRVVVRQPLVVPRQQIIVTQPLFAPQLQLRQFHQFDSLQLHQPIIIH
jgi:hypothetical protein